jgi:sigma-54 specific flagellar transcriptional regulator A
MTKAAQTATSAIIIGSSKVVSQMKRLIETVAPSIGPVLVTGPTGAGKELVAEALHLDSGRSGKFVAVNCAAIPRELMESELFGYEKGAFTGAEKRRIGRFEQSHKGTLFLDEIGDMPLSLQTKLLRVLENHTIQRVGGNDDVPLNLRLVCATHKDLKSMVDKGDFRADLYYRLNVFPIDVPPLNARSEDVIALLEALMQKRIALAPDVAPPLFSDNAKKALAAYDWPGNVRELRNVIERAFTLFSGREISGQHVRENLLSLQIPTGIDPEEQDAIWEAAGADSAAFDDFSEPDFDEAPPRPEAYRAWFDYHENIDLRRHLRDIEVILIEAALSATEGMVSHAADRLNIGRTTLIEKMKKLMIEKSPEV